MEIQFVVQVTTCGFKIVPEIKFNLLFRSLLPNNEFNNRQKGCSRWLRVNPPYYVYFGNVGACYHPTRLTEKKAAKIFFTFICFPPQEHETVHELFLSDYLRSFQSRRQRRRLINMTTHFWLRAETNPNERRTPLTPEDAEKLVQQGVKSKHSLIHFNTNWLWLVTVERSAQRTFTDDQYQNAG